MAVDIDARLGDPLVTAEQKDFDQTAKDHAAAMDASFDAEVMQYRQNLRALSLYGTNIKPKLDTTQRTAYGLRVAAKAAETMTSNASAVDKKHAGVDCNVLQMLLANVTALADATGQTPDDIWTAAKTAGLPAVFQAARVAIANA